MSAADHRRRSLPLIVVVGCLIGRSVHGWITHHDVRWGSPHTMRCRHDRAAPGLASLLQRRAIETTAEAEAATVHPVESGPTSSTGADLKPKSASSRALARSFVPSSFDPLLTGGHLQSILGFFLRDSCGYVPRGNYASLLWQAWEGTRMGAKLHNDDVGANWFWDRRDRIDTPDGDWYHADTKFAASHDGAPSSVVPTVLLLHGLCSSSNSSLAIDVASAVTALGMDCVCLNFRGCSGSMNAKLGGYHLGFTDDLHHYLQLLRRQQPASPVYLVGYSLGANVVLKGLGELNEAAATTFNVKGAVALCAPLDQTKNAKVLAQRGMQQIYTRNLLNALQPMVDRQLQQFCDGDVHTSRFNYEGVVNAQTITDFDEAFIAPVYGFQNATDYYERTSSIQYLDRIRVPTLIVNAKDDPFLDPSVWPAQEHCVTRNPNSYVRMVRTDHGGHLGFCFHQVDDEVDGIDVGPTKRSRQFGDRGTTSSSLRRRRRRPSWVAREVGRFLAHVHRGQASE